MTLARVTEAPVITKHRGVLNGRKLHLPGHAQLPRDAHEELNN
jgi:hypothetical protein